MNKLHEALELCLNEIERGSDVDTVLFRYPELADELRPILDASVKAREMAVLPPSQEVVQRNRAKLLQHAAEMRERKAAPLSNRIWSVPLRRALVTLAVAVLLLVSGTGLVRAASSTLPGDNLYPVKRTWEDLSLLFTFDPEKREALEFEHESERLDELNELFAEGRSAEVDFSGYVTSLSADEWRVSGISVLISSKTRLPDQQVVAGAAVRVRGEIRDGGVAATRIELLPVGKKLPEAEEDETEIEAPNQQNENGSDGKSGSGSSDIKATKTPKPEIETEDKSVEGSVTSIRNNFVVVQGILMDIRFAEIKGIARIGAFAKVEGYFDPAGVFIVTKIEFRNNASDDSGSSSIDNDNDFDDNNDNDNDNDNTNTNTNDDNGGSGGGDNNNNGNENNNND